MRLCGFDSCWGLVDIAEKEMHLRAGKSYGWASTCGHKINYANEDSAEKAAAHQTIKYGKPLEHYPCAFCDGWHIGRTMTQEERETYSIDR